MAEETFSDTTGFASNQTSHEGASVEARHLAIEEKFKHIDAMLDAIRSDLIHIRRRVDSMPSKLQLLGFVLALLSIAGLAKYFAV